jgi:PNKP adenylyltransferase domain, ligase domain
MLQSCRWLTFRIGTHAAQHSRNRACGSDRPFGRRQVGLCANAFQADRGALVGLEQAIAALEVISRFAANPKWLIYLPPTISPSATSAQPGLLEHPAEAFAYFREQGVATVVCQEKQTL